MRKITLLLASFALAGGAFAQDLQTTQQLLDLTKETYAADPCDQVTQSLQYVLGGGDFEYADDLVVPANTSFELEEISALFGVDATAFPDSDDIEITFYADNNGAPGEVIETERPDVIVSVAEAGVLEGTVDILEIALYFDELDEPIVLEAGEEDTSFWVGIRLPYAVGEPGAISTREPEFGHEFNLLIQGEWMKGSEAFNDMTNRDLIYDFYGVCETLDVEDFEMASFSHYVQNGQLFLQSDSTIENAILYNLLGQQVVSSALNATSGSIDLSGLSSGVYLAKLNIDGQVKTLKFFVK